MTEDEMLRKEAEIRKAVELKAEVLRELDVYSNTGFRTFGLRGEERELLEKEIASKVGSRVGYSDDEIKKLTASEEKSLKNAWYRREHEYLRTGSDVFLTYELSNYVGRQETEDLGGLSISIDLCDYLASKKTLAKEIFASKDEQTKFYERRGKNLYGYEYGFDKEEIFKIMEENCCLCKSDRKDIPKPVLKKLSFAEKLKKRFTGKSKTDDENKKIMQQYDRFVENVSELLDGYDGARLSHRDDRPRSLNDLANFERYERLRDIGIVKYNELLDSYCKKRVELDCYNIAAKRFNENNKEAVSRLKAERQQILEQRKVEGAQQKVDEISDPQFRDTEVRKTDGEKTKEAQDRYLARKILKDRGLLNVASASSKAGGVTQTKVNVAAVAAAKQVTH